MSLELVLGISILLVGLTVVGAGVVVPRHAVLEDPAEYLRSLADVPDEADDFQQLLAAPFWSRVLRPIANHMVALLSTVLPSNYRESIRHKLALSGLSGRYRPEEIVVVQVLAAGGALVAALALAGSGATPPGLVLVLLFALPFMAAVVPQAMLNRKVAERKGDLLRDLPDTIDLLAISVEAGMGFEGALAVVCDHFDSALSEELSRTLKEMELGLPRRDALQNLKRRTEVPELSNFVLAIVQADALGMPIGRVLKTQAEEMRKRRRQWAREKAAKLPIKILFPLVLLIFPPIFVVVLGPAASTISQLFNNS